MYIYLVPRTGGTGSSRVSHTGATHLLEELRFQRFWARVCTTTHKIQGLLTIAGFTYARFGTLWDSTIALTLLTVLTVLITGVGSRTIFFPTIDFGCLPAFFAGRRS